MKKFTQRQTEINHILDKNEKNGWSIVWNSETYFCVYRDMWRNERVRVREKESIRVWEKEREFDKLLSSRGRNDLWTKQTSSDLIDIIMIG